MLQQKQECTVYQCLKMSVRKFRMLAHHTHTQSCEFPPLDGDIVCEILNKSFAARNVNEQKLIAQQPRPIPKLKLKTKDSFTTDARPKCECPFLLAIANSVSRFDQKYYNNKTINKAGQIDSKLTY